MGTQNSQNSIRTNQNISAKIDAVLLLFNSPATKGKVVLIYEGKTDCPVYGILFASEKVYFHCFGTCDGFNDLLNRTSQYANRMIVIKDADFDHLNGIKYKFCNFFLTDKHDWETTVFDDDADEKLYNRFCLSPKNMNDSKDSKFSLRDICVEHLKYLSYLKWYNNKNNGYLGKLSNKTLSDFSYDGENGISLVECLEVIKKENPQITVSESDIQQFIDSNPCNDELLLVNGHDLCDAIAIYLRQNLKTHVQGGEKGDVPTIIKSAYSFKKFKKTNLYAGIKKWCKTNKQSIFKDA